MAELYSLYVVYYMNVFCRMIDGCQIEFWETIFSFNLSSIWQDSRPYTNNS